MRRLLLGALAGLLLAASLAVLADLGVGPPGIASGFISTGPTFTLGTGTGACATTSTLVGGPSAGSFLCTGTAGASTIVINLPAIPQHGWTCGGGDTTAGTAWAQVTPTATNSCKLTGTIATTSDQVNFHTQGY